MPSLTFTPIELDTDSPDREAALVMKDGCLLAILVKLSGIHSSMRGKWFLECRFREQLGKSARVFESLEEAGAWIANKSKKPCS